MTNFDKYKDSITRSSFALVNGEIKNCSNVGCIKECDFYSESEECTKIKWDWLKAEYIEPKISIPKDTPIDAKILVSDDGKMWHRRYYAGMENGKHYIWPCGYTSWTGGIDKYDAWEYMKLAED